MLTAVSLAQCDIHEKTDNWKANEVLVLYFSFMDGFLENLQDWTDQSNSFANTPKHYQIHEAYD